MDAARVAAPVRRFFLSLKNLSLRTRKISQRTRTSMAL
jgi:hypothetical protein